MARLNTNDPLIIRQGKHSFPSGHASLSFATATFIILYLAKELKILYFDNSLTFKKFLIHFFIFWLGLASSVAISRYYDNRHYWSDIISGSGLGIVVASLCYYQLKSKKTYSKN